MVVPSGGTSSVSGLLSPREREVARLVARGLANKEIARELGLSQGTVKMHVHSISLKLKARQFLKPGASVRYVVGQLMSGS
jgi:DNA-binding NarL/FixJ family response regulator